jgi:hypothetical protein
VNNFDPTNKTDKCIKYFDTFLSAHITHGNEKIQILNLLLMLMYTQQLWKNVKSQKGEITNIPQIQNGKTILISIKTMQEYENELLKIAK